MTVNLDPGCPSFFLGSVLQIYRVYPSKGRTSRVQVGFRVWDVGFRVSRALGSGAGKHGLGR